MPKVFLSHSSKDKPFVRTLAADLLAKGHDVWLDEWEIRVGNSIPLRIEEGLGDSDFVALVLSEHAVQSKWVEREWHAKFWNQLSTRKDCVLPCLLESCEIPMLLNGIKYANFVRSYSVGLGELLDGIAPVTGKPTLMVAPNGSAIAKLLTKLHAKVLPLSACLAEGVELAHMIGSADLEKFCRSELLGFYPQDGNNNLAPPEQRAPWRIVQAYAVLGKLNPNYMGFSTESSLFTYLETNPDSATPIRFCYNHSVEKIEQQAAACTPQSTALSINQKLGSFNKETKSPDALVTTYMRPHAPKTVLASIREEFCKRLLDLMPAIDG